MGIRGWRKLSKERTEWRRITEKAKTTVGCNTNKIRKKNHHVTADNQTLADTQFLPKMTHTVSWSLAHLMRSNPYKARLAQCYGLVTCNKQQKWIQYGWQS
jgi:hypothetical protein